MKVRLREVLLTFFCRVQAHWLMFAFLLTGLLVQFGVYSVCLVIIFIQYLHAVSADLDDLVSNETDLHAHFDLDDPASNETDADLKFPSQSFYRYYKRRHPRISPISVAKENNYPAEAHKVTTEDGYILTIYRIPGRRGSPAVLLQHGLLESGIDWLITGKKRSLGFILADQGYDVWLGNARGNTYSKKHQSLSISDPEFWNFSWEELGRYDLPAVINYISDLKDDHIFYIGHSMGCTTFSVMAIERPDVAKKVKAMIGLAPATYVYHMRGAVKTIAPFWNSIQRSANRLGIYEIFSRNGFTDAFAEFICNSFFLKNVVCSNALYLIAGHSPKQLDKSLLSTIWKIFPAGTSVKLFSHWLQQISVDKFSKFDYGPQTNLKVYNRKEPPTYDLSKVQVPVAVFWSKNDLLVGEKDINRFYNELPIKSGIFRVEDNKFNHFDFLWAYDAPKLVYRQVLELLAQHNN